MEERQFIQAAKQGFTQLDQFILFECNRGNGGNGSVTRIPTMLPTSNITRFPIKISTAIVTVIPV